MSEHQQTQQSKNPEPSSQRRTIPTNPTPVSHPAAIIQRARINPKSLTSADILQLQRTIGNRAVGRLLSEIRNPSKVQQVPIQRQEIPEEEKEPLQGMFGKKPEEETCPSCVQRQEKPEEEEPLQGKFETIQRLEPEEEEKLQMKSVVQRQEIPEEEDEPVQGKMIGTVQRQEIKEEEEPLQTKRENNTGMPDNLKAGVESLSGIDMSDVKVHYNSSKPAEVGALAYTQGTNIHVAPGQERHLPHEAWHVVQQKQGRVQATTQMKGIGINDDPSLEHEADMMGAKTAQFVPSPDEEMLQRKFGEEVEEKAPNNMGLSDNLKAGIENLSGMSMDRVKVHYNYGKPAQLNALAYVQGSDIHMGLGQERDLKHDEWHMVQQKKTNPFVQDVRGTSNEPYISQRVIQRRWMYNGPPPPPVPFPLEQEHIEGIINNLSPTNRGICKNEIWRMAISSKDYPTVNMGDLLQHKNQTVNINNVRHALATIPPVVPRPIPATMELLMGVPWQNRHPGDRDIANIQQDLESADPQNQSNPGRFGDIDLINGSLNNFADKIKSMHGSPHLAIAYSLGKIRMAGNTRPPINYREAKAIVALFRQEFAADPILSVARISFRNVGGGGSSIPSHGEMDIITSILKKARATHRTEDLPTESIMLAGNKLDCTKCHAAMIAFNRRIGPKYSLKLLSNGYNGMWIEEWKPPSWLNEDPNAYAEYHSVSEKMRSTNTGDDTPEFD